MSRPGLYIHAAAAQAAVSFRNFGFSPIWTFAPISQTDAPHIIAAAQIFLDQTGSVWDTLYNVLTSLILDFSLFLADFLTHF